MFQGSLLESSSGARKRNRWPMATAFTLQMAVAAALVIIPLLSTGIIPLSARVVDATPVYTPVAAPPTDSSSGSSSGVSAPANTTVVPVNPGGLLYPHGRSQSGDNTKPEIPALPYCLGNCTGPAIGSGNGPVLPIRPPEEPKRVRVSHLEEGMLVRKVMPVYPRIAIPTGVQGDVKLHAIIAKDGSIQSLNVISGPPLLASAALEAVSQWKYRPYLLNDEPVEVETYITVTFTRNR